MALELRPEEIKAEFARRQKRQLLALLPLVVVLIACRLGMRDGSDLVFGIPFEVWKVGFLVMTVWSLRFQYKHWRCPACDHPFRRLLVRDCRKCGVWLVGRAPWP